ncbi:MAG TPA: hypothetical protein VJ809_13910 [Pirellulales bacterium]|nr:hypothetical protein [Pirellulales bacterium]
MQHRGGSTNGKWSLEIDADNPQILNFPSSAALARTAYDGMAYITPRVKLEFGPRGAPMARFRKS